jgi:hypothetical protein
MKNNLVKVGWAGRGLGGEEKLPGQYIALEHRLGLGTRAAS